jgi:hypothetical protein
MISHTLKFTTAHMKSSQYALFSPMSAGSTLTFTVNFLLFWLPSRYSKINSVAGGHLTPTSYSSPLNFLKNTLFKLMLIYYKRSVGQSILVSGSHLESMTRFLFSAFSQSQSYITTDSQSASLSWCRAPIWYPRSIFPHLSLIIFRQLWVRRRGAPSLTRSRICSFQFLPGIASAAFRRSESHGLMSIFCLYFWDFPSLDGHVPVFISPRNMVTQLYPFSLGYSVEVEVKLRPTVGRLPSGAHDQIFFFLFDNCGFLAVGRPLWQEDGSVIYLYNCFWVLPEQSLWSPCPAELRPYFTVSFQTLSTCRARSPYLYPPERGWPSYSPGHWVPISLPFMTLRAMAEVFCPTSTRV